MPIVEPRLNNEYPWYIRLIMKMMKRKLGVLPEPMRILGRSPGMFLGAVALRAGAERKSSPLDPELRALVAIVISWINHCATCVDLHAYLVLRGGGSEEKLRELADYRNSPVFTDRERISLAYAEAVTDQSSRPSEEMFAKLREYYTEDEIVELTGVIAVQNYISKFNSALEIEPQGFCSLAFSGPEREKGVPEAGIARGAERPASTAGNAVK